MIFPPDYARARERFLAAAGRAGFACERHPTDARGPGGEPLSVDVARGGDPMARRAVVVSGGLHGVEGFLGSAVQTAWMERAAGPVPPLAASRRPLLPHPEDCDPPAPVGDAASGRTGNLVPSLPPGVAVVLIHALNPWGFTHLRRTDERNVDLNRSFLPSGGRYEGSPPLYGRLDPALNPRRPPARLDPFPLHALAALARYGRAAVTQAVAGGQHDFPHGLFFGGREEGEAARLLREHLPRWVGGARRVLHLDFHTGLGRPATCRLLADFPLGPCEAWVRERFGNLVVEPRDVPAGAYRARGSLGGWCRELFPDRSYVLLVAEFGTYSALRVLAALRRENQAHHHCPPGDPRVGLAKDRLREVFGPASPRWRRACLDRGLALIHSAVEPDAGWPAPDREVSCPSP